MESDLLGKETILEYPSGERSAGEELQDGKRPLTMGAFRSDPRGSFHYQA